jgi:hypothetical protein
MNYDLDYRYRRALHPDGLRTIANATQAVSDAMADCRRAGHHCDTDPAVLLLARHLGRIASGCDPEFMHEDDLQLRSQCMNRIAELKTKPALVAIVRGRDRFNAEEKSLFHAEAKKALRSLAATAGLTPADYDLRSNMAGPAVSGEAVLHTDDLYVMVSKTLTTPGKEVLYRTCKGRHDYTGSSNSYADIAVLADPRKFLARIARETGVRFPNLEPQLV